MNQCQSIALVSDVFDMYCLQYKDIFYNWKIVVLLFIYAGLFEDCLKIVYRHPHNIHNAPDLQCITLIFGGFSNLPVLKNWDAGIS